MKNGKKITINVQFIVTKYHKNLEPTENAAQRKIRKRGIPIEVFNSAIKVLQCSTFHSPRRRSLDRKESSASVAGIRSVAEHDIIEAVRWEENGWGAALYRNLAQYPASKRGRANIVMHLSTCQR